VKNIGGDQTVEFHKAMRASAQAGEAMSMGAWRGVDSAPNDGGYVLVSGGSVVLVAYQLRGSWYTETAILDWRPTHWMPLPEPPK
jgi:Protein of unknown function (DUF551)